MAVSLETEITARKAHNTAQIAFIATKLAKNISAIEAARWQATSDALAAENTQIDVELTALAAP